MNSMAKLMEVNASIENASVTFAQNSIKENTERIIKKIDFDGNKVFIVKQESCGANLWQMSNSDINKVGDGKTNFLVVGVKHNKTGKIYNYALGSVSKVSTDLSMLHDEKLDLLLSSGFTLVKVVYAKKVYDCQTFVNASLKGAKLNTLNAQPIKDVISAKQNYNVPFMKFKEVLNEKSEINIDKFNAFYDNANVGDVLLFVKKVAKSEVKELKKSMTLIEIDGTYYAPEHVTLYSGKDKENKHSIIQSHIYGGTIAEEPVLDYSSKYKTHYDGVFVIPQDYFKSKKDISKMVPKLK